MFLIYFFHGRLFFMFNPLIKPLYPLYKASKRYGGNTVDKLDIYSENIKKPQTLENHENYTSEKL